MGIDVVWNWGRLNQYGLLNYKYICVCCINFFLEESRSC